MTSSSADNKQSIEWPTIVVAGLIYLGFGLVTWFHHDLPWWLILPLGAYFVAWHGSLQHEVVHGHPTSNAVVNHALVFPSLWLWLPFLVYKRTHTAHHLSERLAKLGLDPESFYVTADQWRSMGKLGRGFLTVRNTLAGRLIFGPAESIGRLLADEWRRFTRGDSTHLGAWMVHLVGCAAALWWILVVCEIPLWAYIALYAYPGLSITLLRSFLEHQAHGDPTHSTVIIEA